MGNGFFLILTIAAICGSALVAGIFFAFSTFVMAALSRLPAPQGIAAMQAINVTVLNPWFFGVFFGTAVLALVLLIYALFNWSMAGAGFLLAGALLYLVGTILVTVVFNVPLNERLAARAPESGDGAELWTHYLSRWTAWNHVRTLAPLLAAICFLMAAL
ncbi:anthrone oxygenase family protein [Methyloligella sp. 2.7D]|uniref:anthrone oxygenase family protein n=1 Tax=unclassified Methyloligella TaxID=2625955 RepID=UPI00157C31AE|nr:anthrone oxygenase family protein [Methyloligella sp. GL2]QKP76972.1 DUF1772 domain-containing protein [Methyloligella sp. GL2]